MISLFGKRLRWLTCFLAGLLVALFASSGLIAAQPSSAAISPSSQGMMLSRSELVRQTGTHLEAASSHLEPNFY